jgi:tetraacyldisaccharide 4'-kinase
VRVARPLSFDEGAVVIAVGGATLGGSGKTPLAVASARWLATQGVSVALVGHAYGARPDRARVVQPDDPVDVVGDEALDAAVGLAGSSVQVVVGPSRQRALDHGLRLARVAVIDGVLQSAPRRATLSLLALDAARPWGSARCPPGGDLRAPSAALLRACDRAVLIGDGPAASRREVPTDLACVNANGLTLGSRKLGWAEVRGVRVGLWTHIARPDRVVGLLRARGIAPSEVVHLADHARGRAVTHAMAGAVKRGVAHRVDLWVCTSKCARRLPGSIGGVPIATIDYAVSVPGSLQEALRIALGGSKEGSGVS